ncbi:MAG: hypothetical protein ISS47_07700 [Candidatus Omnitrophica bacterium]|nr:hypothetical protein [Candidatus Omnitrophota bacterium]
MQNKPPTKKQLNVFVFGLTLILFLFSWKSYRANNSKVSFILIGLVFVLLIIYLTKKDFVLKFYQVWMRCVSVIGMVITGILMIIIFYLLFTPVGLFLRLIRKDILNLKSDTRLKTYWIDKPKRAFEKVNYERQF